MFNAFINIFIIRDIEKKKQPKHSFQTVSFLGKHQKICLTFFVTKIYKVGKIEYKQQVKLKKNTQ